MSKPEVRKTSGTNLEMTQTQMGTHSLLWDSDTEINHYSSTTIHYNVKQYVCVVK